MTIFGLFIPIYEIVLCIIMFFVLLAWSFVCEAENRKVDEKIRREFKEYLKQVADGLKEEKKNDK